MGRLHLDAYAALPGYEVVGLCTHAVHDEPSLPAALAGLPRFRDLADALAATRPEIVSINTHVDTHVAFSIKALRAGAHVFVEKPLAPTLAEAEAVVATARARRRKLVVGYVLRHHPGWLRFAEIASGLGRPLVMRINLNQQSTGAVWGWHKDLLRWMSPLGDCGVHYVDMMRLMTGSEAVRVQAVGARLSDELAPGRCNWAQLQVVFADGSVGWFEAGWGPMASEVAGFVKDVWGPRGAVSMVVDESLASAALDSYTRPALLRCHHADGRPDETIRLGEEPSFAELCRREQAFLRAAIEADVDLEGHWRDSLASLAIALAAEESLGSGRPVEPARLAG
jgi:predicted dehydrogenase